MARDFPITHKSCNKGKFAASLKLFSSYAGEKRDVLIWIKKKTQTHIKGSKYMYV